MSAINILNYHLQILSDGLNSKSAKQPNELIARFY